MWVEPNFIYLRMPRTATAYLVGLLEQIGQGRGRPRKFCKNYHDGIWAVPERLRQGKSILGSIRNPFTWYVSYWAMACKKQKFWNRSRQGPDNIQYLFEDVYSKKAFEEWLDMLLYKNEPFEEEYDSRPYRNKVGFYTHWFVRTFCKDYWNIRNVTTEVLKGHSVNHWVYIESLKADLTEFFKGLKLSKRKQRFISTNNSFAMRKTRGHITNHAPVEYYHNEFTKRLIKEKDGLLLNRFGYEFPEQY